MFKFESPSPKDVSSQVWLILTQLFGKRRFLNFTYEVLQCGCYLTSEKGVNLLKTFIPFIQEYFVPSLVAINPLVLEKKICKFCECIFTIHSLFYCYLPY